MDYDLYILKHIADNLTEKTSGLSVSGVLTGEKGKIVFEFNDGQALEYSILPGLECLRILSNFSRPGKNYTEVLNEASGKKISNFALFKNDRIVSMALNDGFMVLFSFIKSRRNCLVVKDGKIVDSFKEMNLIKGKDIDNYLPHSLISKDPPQYISEYARLQYPDFNKNICDEIILRSGLKLNDPLNGSNTDTLELMFGKIIDSGSSKFYLIISDKQLFVSPVPIERDGFSVEGEYELFEGVYRSALRLQYKRFLDKTVKDKILYESEKKIKNIEKKISSLRLHLKNCETSDDLLNFGNTILSNIHGINPGDKFLECEDISGKKVKIRLRPDLRPSENANRYFEKYKGQKESANVLKKRISKLEKDLTKAQSEHEAVSNKNDLKSISKMGKLYLREKSEEDEAKLFRKFVLNDRYEVWVGKDSYSNDLLTTRYSSPHDLWFHVRGASGSHTVLRVHNKGDKVEKEFIKKAASIAAYYSKARNASNADVAYCERKYVKKKKGLRSGTVVMEREKVVNVKPALPGEDQ